MEVLLKDSKRESKNEDEIYENIEAPKFVDFTVPDLSKPDDRSWFCLRVGCDQKHDETIDPDFLYKSFMLRVMSARSPNVRLRKTLRKQSQGEIKNHPLSAPAKTAKSRIPKLEMIAEIASTKRQIHTPNRKIKQSPVSVSAQALTTPKRRYLPKNESFRSVQHLKSSVSVLKNRSVTKTLVFTTPKKEMKKSEECHISVAEICNQMKGIEINHAKCLSKKLCKLAESEAHDVNSTLQYNSEIKQNREIRTDNLDQAQALQGVENYSSDMEIEGKSRKDCVWPSDTRKRKENETLDGDDKENSSSFDSNSVEHIKKESHGSLMKDIRIPGKSKKSKLTNPKPFRLRTDERGILREANLKKEIAPISNVPTGNSQETQRNKKQDRTVPAYLKSTKSAESKITRLPPQRVKGEEKKIQEQGEKSPPSPKLVTPQSGKSQTKIRKFCASAHNPVSTASGTKSHSRQRNTPTIPKEPNFHSLHKSKSFTNKLLEATLL